MTNYEHENTPLQDKLDWLEYIARTPKQNLELIPKKALDTQADKKAFILAWFQVTNWSKKLDLAYTHGLVALDDNQRFEVRNSFSRDYEDLRLAVMAIVYWRDQSQCAYCGLGIQQGAGQIDHVIPRSAWPQEWLWLADDSSNLVPAHKKCNLEKSNFYRKFQGENRLHHVTMDCGSKRAELYECCKSRRTDQDNPMCQECDEYVYVLCNIHEETYIPACEVPTLKAWFGHDN